MEMQIELNARRYTRIPAFQRIKKEIGDLPISIAG